VGTALTGFIRRLWRELLGFSAVGLVGVVFDITTFNVVDFGFHAPRVYGSLAGTTLGTIVSYLGNRYWVFRRRELRQSRAEIGLFVLVSAIGIGITAGCVAFNTYVLGYDGVIGSNIAQFVFGQGLGSIFRFWGMHTFVFPETHEHTSPAERGTDAPAGEGQGERGNTGDGKGVRDEGAPTDDHLSHATSG
jgi:putative flippase GtrA